MRAGTEETGDKREHQHIHEGILMQKSVAQIILQNIRLYFNAAHESCGGLTVILEVTRGRANKDDMDRSARSQVPARKSVQ